MSSNLSIAFFKPYQKGKGAGLIFEFGEKAKTLFISTMPEKDGGGGFDSKAKINFKVGQSDIGDIMAVLSGRKDGCGNLKDGKWSGLYHQMNNGGTSTVLSLSVKETGGYSIGLSKKTETNQSRHGISLTVGEATLILEFLRSQMGLFVSNLKNNQRTVTTS